MPEFAKGLKLEVTDRDDFEEFVEENAHDPGMQMENWGANSVPQAIYIGSYTDDEPSAYKAYDAHVNGEVSWNYWNEPLLEDALDAGVLENTGEYDVDLVDEHSD